jgi:hypothetical protein
MQRHTVLTMRARLVFVGDAEIMASVHDPENPDVVYNLPKFFELDPRITTQVGRDSSCNLILNHPKQIGMVSNKHLHFELNEGQWIITDGTGGKPNKPSLNGTLLNGIRVETAVLKDGDTLVFGGARCDKKLIAPNTAPPPTSVTSLYKFRVEIFHPQPALAKVTPQQVETPQQLESRMLPPKITETSVHEKKKIHAFLKQKDTVEALLRKQNEDLERQLEKMRQQCGSDLVRGLQGQAKALSLANILLQHENDSHVKTINNQAIQITKHEGEIRKLTEELKERKNLDLHEVLAQIFQDDGEDLRGLMQCVKTRVSIKYQTELDKANLGNQVSELKIQRLEEEIRRLEEEIRRLETEQPCAKKQKCTAAASPETSPEASPEASSDFQQGYPPHWQSGEF